MHVLRICVSGVWAKTIGKCFLKKKEENVERNEWNIKQHTWRMSVAAGCPTNYVLCVDTAVCLRLFAFRSATSCYSCWTRHTRSLAHKTYLMPFHCIQQKASMVVGLFRRIASTIFLWRCKLWNIYLFIGSGVIGMEIICVERDFVGTTT